MIVRYIHDCPTRIKGVEIYKEGELGFWYIWDHVITSHERNLRISHCPFCGAEL